MAGCLDGLWRGSLATERPLLKEHAGLAGLAQLAGALVARYGLAALFLMITVEEAGVWLPVPSDLFIIYFASQAVRAPRPAVAAGELLLTVVLGVLCGSLLLYLLARRYRWLLRRLGRFLRFDEQRLERMEGWVRRHGAIIIVPVRLIPGLRIVPSIVSGTSAVPVRTFLPMVAISAVIWGSLLLGVGVGGSAVLASFPGVQELQASKWLLPAIFIVVALLAALELWRPWRTAAPRKK